jgi:hypothetical protein
MFIYVLTAIQFFPSSGAHLLNEFLLFVFINVSDSINLQTAEGSVASRVCNKTHLKIKLTARNMFMGHNASGEMNGLRFGQWGCYRLSLGSDKL